MSCRRGPGPHPGADRSPRAGRGPVPTRPVRTGGECREVADGLAHVVPVRDSKVPHGPVLEVGAGAWPSFVGAIRSGELAR
ncbi:DUF397 domain-containing protein [Streptomyces tirandamycinicus]|uniref:DUF397 domain-containing protein n=1 Tax=Streptomyces tirandamycinicus TaxID=2174846 RepID=UPI002D1E4154|nr:DUF397 domain-containing protein [Streptomyces tirandamycinicus]